MEFSKIVYERFSRVARITLNRPEARNALNIAILQDLSRAMEEVRGNKEIKVLVIAARGEAFCSGGDVDFLMAGLADKSAVEIRNILKEHYGGAALSMRSLEKPVIGAIQGPALGAGFDLSLHFDLRLASPKATFGSIWVRIATIPALGGMFLLPRIIGLARATEMILTGDEISAEEAHRIGLVNRVIPHEELLERAMSYAERLANGPSMALSIAKQGLNRGLDGTLLGEVDWAVYMQGLCISSADCAEGMRAFKERRKPVFRGE